MEMQALWCRRDSSRQLSRSTALPWRRRYAIPTPNWQASGASMHVTVIRGAPVTSEFRDRARALHAAIKDVLLKEWDPIGVQAIPEAQDEYDAYVSAIYSMLISRKPVSEVFKYL